MRRTPVVLVSLSLLLSSCGRGASRADVAPQAGAPSDPARLTEPRSRTLLVRLAGTPLGDVIAERVPLPDGGNRFVVRSKLTMALDDPGQQPLTLESEEVQELGPDHRLRRSSSVDREQGVEDRVEITVTDGVLRAVVDGPAHHDDRSFPVPADFGTGHGAFEAMRAEVAAGAALPLTRRYQEFDADDMAFSHHTMTLRARTTVPTAAGVVAVWEAEMLDEADGERVVALIDDDDLPVRMDLGGITAAVAGVPDDGVAPSRLSSYLAVEGKLDASRPSQRVDLIVAGDAADPAPALVTGPYHRVTRDGERYALELLPRRASARVKAPTLPLTPPADVARYLAPTAASQSKDPGIVAVAQELAAGETDSRKVAAAITMAVYAGLEKTDGVRGAATAVETLAAGKGDCTEHAALAVALHRAVGIPARIVGGMVFVATPNGAEAGYHAWTEVWLGEWVAMDPALGAVDVGPSYVWFGYDEPGDPSGTVTMTRLFGRTRVVVP